MSDKPIQKPEYVKQPLTRRQFAGRIAAVAGLGGAGMTASAAVGELAAAMLLGRDVDAGARAAFDPVRLIPAE